MPIFACSKCETMDNSAVADYWHCRDAPLCSECSPRYKAWHGRFEKMSAEGYIREADGFTLVRPLVKEPTP